MPQVSIQPTPGFIPFKIEQSIPQRFEQQAHAHGNRIAIKSERETYTFSFVNQSANRLARMIRSRRGGSPEPIALLFDHDQFSSPSWQC
jgi:non-ribosomal peptide synthetase component F